MNIIMKDGVEYYPRGDGDTHINVYSKGKTELGRWLTNFTYETVLTPYGMMNSMESYYHYLKIQRALIESNMLRVPKPIERAMVNLTNLHGRAAQEAGRSARKLLRSYGITLNDVPNAWFNEQFMLGLEYKLRKSPDKLALLQDELADGKVLLHYYTYGNTVHHKGHFDWLGDRIIDVVNKIEDEV